MTDPIAQLVRLRGRAEALRSTGLNERIRWVHESCRRWVRAGDARRGSVRAIAEETGLSEAMVEWMLDAFFDSVAPSVLERLVRREMPALARGPVDSPSLALHVLAATVPTVAAESAVLSLLAGVPVAIRASRRQRAFAESFVASLEGTSASEFVEMVDWPSDDTDTTASAVGHSELVVVYGGDDAVGEFRALGAQCGVPVQGFGHRVSVGIVGDATAAHVGPWALDVAAVDQAGCMSPHTLFVPSDHATSFASELYDALVALDVELPIGAYAPGAWIRVNTACDLVRFTGNVYEARSARVLLHGDGGFRPSPGLRTIHVAPYSDESELLDAIRAVPVPLSVIGVDDISAQWRERILAVRTEGVRFASAGEMQRPPLDRLHDGHPRIAEWFGTRE